VTHSAPTRPCRSWFRRGFTSCTWGESRATCRAARLVAVALGPAEIVGRLG
jgi:hypothetical protein